MGHSIKALFLGEDTVENSDSRTSNEAFHGGLRPYQMTLQEFLSAQTTNFRRSITRNATVTIEGIRYSWLGDTGNDQSRWSIVCTRTIPFIHTMFCDGKWEGTYGDLGQAIEEYLGRVHYGHIQRALSSGEYVPDVVIASQSERLAPIHDEVRFAAAR